MAGQLIQRGSRTWLVRVSLGRRSETGKRMYLNRTVHGAEKDAERVLHVVLRDRDLGTLTEGNRLTMDEYLDQWLTTAAHARVRERTCTATRGGPYTLRAPGTRRSAADAARQPRSRSQHSGRARDIRRLNAVRVGSSTSLSRVAQRREVWQ